VALTGHHIHEIRQCSAGGPPYESRPLRRYNSITQAKVSAATSLLQRVAFGDAVLSGYLAATRYTALECSSGIGFILYPPVWDGQRKRKTIHEQWDRAIR
jgi:hypothetical protein